MRRHGRGRMAPHGRLVARLVVALCLAKAAGAAVCAVPSGTHATIQSAVDDAACTSVALATASYAESVQIRRSLAIVGVASPASLLDGRLQILGATTVVTLSGLGLRNGCTAPALAIGPGAHVASTDVHIAPAALPCPELRLFRDGFESGATSQWY